MLDVGGQDATEAFEDVGHSDEAREILEGMLVGTLKRQVSGKKKKKKKGKRKPLFHHHCSTYPPSTYPAATNPPQKTIKKKMPLLTALEQ